MPIAAIYARVSSDKQREEGTIASQTAALIGFARSHGYQVPMEWVFEDEGYSGASLVRPGLERVRDLAAEGQIEAVLVYAPDRLSRKYAYQILLIEELARHGVDTVFMQAPQTATAEDQLLVQFQGMIAEYERAQILERSRRGKRHRARQEQVNVLSGAPYGYAPAPTPGRQRREAPAVERVRRRQRRLPVTARDTMLAGRAMWEGACQHTASTSWASRGWSRVGSPWTAQPTHQPSPRQPR